MNNKILQSAIQYLSRREHSTLELIRKLEQKGYQRNEIDEVIKQLQQNNYLSDERFAESVLRNRVSKGYGKRFIEQELKLKGVDESEIYALMKNQQIDWYVQAELAYNKRFANVAIVDVKDKAKRVRFLQSRGFASDEIFSLFSNDSFENV
jgi:regulatory protein